MTTRVTAETLSRRQREISVSEFFAKNRHLLGFDSLRKALLTTVKEAVDNSLDACEEAGILPEIWVELEVAKGTNRYLVRISDNGPGIVPEQAPKIFGQLLYGSKFHSLKQSRGQQGIGISAAAMYGQLTTGKPVSVESRTGPEKRAYAMQVMVDTNTNKPKAIGRRTLPDWHLDHGTLVELELEAKYLKGRQSVEEFLHQVAVANPHVTLHYRSPTGETASWARTVQQNPVAPQEIKPHPHGVRTRRADEDAAIDQAQDGHPVPVPGLQPHLAAARRGVGEAGRHRPEGASEDRRPPDRSTRSTRRSTTRRPASGRRRRTACHRSASRSSWLV